MEIRVILATILLTANFSSFAELKDLTESEMSDISGDGIALVYENFQFNAANNDFSDNPDNNFTFKITGIEDQNDNPVDVSLSHLYIAGPGTNFGTDFTDKVVNIGRLNNPFTIDLLDGNNLGGGVAEPDGWTDKAVLSLAAPTHVALADGYDCTSASATKGSGTCSSRPDPTPGDSTDFNGERMDLGIRINTEYSTDPSKNTNINFHAQSAHFDGSYVRLWGDDVYSHPDSQGDDQVVFSGMVGEAQLNFYADKVMINSCTFSGSNCGHNVGFDGLSLELALGDAKFFQPMSFDVTSNGHFKFMIHQLPGPTHRNAPSSTGNGNGTINATGTEGSGTDQVLFDWYEDYYTNGRKTNIRVNELTVGSESFGSSTIEGFQIQYLEVTSHDL